MYRRTTPYNFLYGSAHEGQVNYLPYYPMVIMYSARRHTQCPVVETIAEWQTMDSFLYSLASFLNALGMQADARHKSRYARHRSRFTIY